MLPFSNPARVASARGAEIYPYYAGFSKEFVEDAISWATEGKTQSLVLDPWNGSGTTTRTANQLGFRSIGFDLNPVMVLVAKAELLDPAEASVLCPLAKRIVKGARSAKKSEGSQPLDVFFDRSASHEIVQLARSIWLHVVATSLPRASNESLTSWKDIAPLAGIFYVALFNTVRRLLQGLATTNPTWLRVPKNSEPRVCVDSKTIGDAFLAEVERIQEIAASRRMPALPQPTTLTVGDSRSLPLRGASVNAIVTSPPYCTRLDYGRSTMPELLILESLGIADYKRARQQLMGAATARNSSQSSPLGRSCQELLERIRVHPSKASGTYYFQSHLAYFSDLASSVMEISRVLVPNGRACLVVQDSYYKEIHNDLPRILEEMAGMNGMSVINTFSYQKKKTMRGLNKGSQVYLDRSPPVEVAMLLSKDSA